MKYTSTILAAAAIANAAPAQPVCSVIVQIVTGTGYWVPNADPTTWAAWSSSSSSSSAVKTSSSVDPTWAAWSSTTSSTPAIKTSTSADPTSWYAWGPSSAPSSSVSATTSTSVIWTKPATTSKVETTTTSKGGEFYPTTTKSATTTSAVETTTTTPAHITTTAATTTSSSTTTTTTEAPKATATCPASSGSAFQASGSCECSYNINCGVKTSPGQGTNFWERHSGELIDTLDECIAICDENSSCTAVLYVDQEGASAQDYKHCWQTSGLPQPDGTGYAKISYKGACSGSCSAGYSAPQ